MRDSDPVIALVRDTAPLADCDATNPVIGSEVRDRVLHAADTATRARIHRRPPRWLTIAATVVVLGGGSFATAAVLNTPKLAPEEIDSFAQRNGVSRPTAQQHLEDQRKVPALTETARARLGDAFGGVRIDNPGDLRIKLALVAGTDASTRTEARTVIADSGLLGRVDLEAVPRSERDVIAIQAQIDRELLAVNRGAADRVEVEPDPAGGRLLVRKPRPVASITPAQRRYLDSLTARYGNAVVIREGLGRLRLDIRPGHEATRP